MSYFHRYYFSLPPNLHPRNIRTGTFWLPIEIEKIGSVCEPSKKGHTVPCTVNNILIYCQSLINQHHYGINRNNTSNIL